MEIMNICFAHPRYVYDSYTDYRKLVELSGFQTCFIDEIDLKANTLYIVSPINGEFRPHVAHRRSILTGPQNAKIVWLNLERPDSGPGDLGKLIGSMVCNTTNEILQWVDAIWVSDRYYASLDRRMTFVAMGSDDRLGRTLGHIGKAYDWCHLSYTNDRRSAVYADICRRGMRQAPNGWGSDREHILRASRAMVYVHQTAAPIGAPLRWALAAAYRVPLLCENLADPYPLEPGRDLMMCEYQHVAQNVPGWIVSEAVSIRMGEALYKTLCIDHSFKKSVLEGARTVK